MAADACVIMVGTNRLAYLIAVHELGHVIGLAHDDFESSPMYPVTVDDSGSEVLRTIRVSDSDVRLLRTTYADRHPIGLP
jgi:predicted Zn-dependent protease